MRPSDRSGEGFYRSKRPITGFEQQDRRAFTILVQKPISSFALNATPVYKVYRPGTGLGATTALRDFVMGGRFESVDAELAQKGWRLIYDDAVKHCSHGPNCKNKQFCVVGKRVEARHVVTGAVLPYWTYLQQVVGHTTTQASDRAIAKVKSRMSIVRVRFVGADNKEQRLVGIEVKTDAEMRR